MSSRETAFLLTGAGGMLATALAAQLERERSPYWALSEQELDITDEVAVDEALGRFARSFPGRQMVINAAAYTDVERAEDEPEQAYRVNESAPRLLAEVCRAMGVGMVHVSTDFVFDGEKEGAYIETDRPAPLSVYGASKLAGERAVLGVLPSALVVRTAWTFGPAGRSFPAKILERARAGGDIGVVSDQRGSPTYTGHLAAGLLGLVARGGTGLFHLTAEGSCSRWELAVETLRLAGVEASVEPVTADAFPTKARRPRNSVLDCGRARDLGVRLPPWEEGLREFLSGSSSTRAT